MVAARLRQAAARLASSLAASGAALATSRPARVAGKTLAVGAAGAATYKAAEYGLGETVPYGADGGRRRGPEPLWAAALGTARMGFPMRLGPAEVSELTELGYIEVERQLGPDGLTPPPAGQIQIHWIRPEGKMRAGVEDVYSAPYQQAVAACMQAVVAALRQEAEEKGFGKHVLEHGFNVIVTPRDCPQAESLPSDAILLPAGLIEDCVAFTRKPNNEADLPAAMAALKFVLSHELAHLYLRHGLPMLLRATAPPVALGGRYSSTSVAEQVAEQLAAGLAAEAAAKEAAAKAAEVSAKEAAGNAAEVAALAGAVAVGVAAAAAAAANAAADSRPV
ncbi:hypothetical protein C2E21_7907 [Chlorella sorokiniana]|uniref:Uncharacterized protein n=1 Tax=Chlorella sorokiniana TaxID=3076 RepID=A0A2P6TGB9_CHLSO|nr:hypothetical protein C2E21_7907 [Chlorella sorokiniana]|eukprot:PRW33156.1 hypothetical protein C2E21_7907 [Chlorella sorokiniana]